MAATSLAGLSRPGLPLSCSVPTGKKSAAARVKSEAPTRGRESLDVQHSLLHTTRPPLRHGWGHQKKKKIKLARSHAPAHPAHTPACYIYTPLNLPRLCCWSIYKKSEMRGRAGGSAPRPPPRRGPWQGPGALPKSKAVALSTAPQQSARATARPHHQPLSPPARVPHAIRPSHPPAVLVTYIPEHQSSTHAAQAQAPHSAQRAAAPEGGQSSAPATPAPSHQGPLHDAGNPQPSKSLYIYTASHRRKATSHQPPATSQVEPPASQPPASRQTHQGKSWR